MKKTGFARRALAMLLVVVMTLQVIPGSVLALNSVGDLVTGNQVQSNVTGIVNNTLSAEDAIKWPIKIYDYLDDGMLFEWNDSQDTGYVDGTYHDATGGTPPYGGGTMAPTTKIGVDFTDPKAYTEAGWKSYTSGSTGNRYALTRKDAVDYVTPQYMNVKKSTGNNYNICVGSWYTDYSQTYSLTDIRYMTMVYRGTNLSGNNFSMLFGYSDYWDRTVNTVIPDSSGWTYIVLDLLALNENVSLTGIQSAWIGWGYFESNLSDDLSCDITHIGFFDNRAQAENYGEAAVAFDNDPGEYLKHSTSIPTSGETLAVTKPSNILSLHYYYKNGTSGPITASDGLSNWGMDLTHDSTANGQYTNYGYTDTYYTWAVGGNAMTWDYNGSYPTRKFNAMNVSRGTTAEGVGYTRLTNASGDTGDTRILLTKFRERENELYGVSKANVNYLVLVYRTNNFTSNDTCGLCVAGFPSATGGTGVGLGAWSNPASWKSNSAAAATLSAASGWHYAVIDLESYFSLTSKGINYLKRVGLYLPALTNGKSLDLAYVAYFSDSTTANSYGRNAAAYMNGEDSIFIPGATVNFAGDRQWVTGNNKSFGLLFASSGGGWAGRWGGTPSNTYTNSYYKTWMIGYDLMVNSEDNHNSNRIDPMTGEHYSADYTGTSSNKTVQNVTGGTTNKIYMAYAEFSDDGLTDTNDKKYDTSVLDFDGYDLMEVITTGLCTLGLLEGSLSENRLPVYRQETVEYIAYNLHHALTIPQRDEKGNYNLNYITGSTSTHFGGVDLNGDGVIGMADLDGDCRNETNENSVDLATALRHELGIKFTLGTSKGTYGTLGTYAETAAKGDKLIGTFEECRGYIETAMDAAYFMLNNLFTANSFNQEQDDYNYLELGQATMSDGRTAYVFDAGFSTGAGAESITSDAQEEAYAAGSQSSVQYSPVVSQDENGNPVYGTGTISLGNVGSKDKFWYNTGGSTTRFPFLPVTDAEGEYAGKTDTYYFNNDGVRSYLDDLGTYEDRNYNYVMVSNGEFVYYEEENLFFEFEGDDDVYLFINGQLVLDIGAGHSITSVGINVNDYVEAARKEVAEMGDAASDRAKALALEEGQICQFDFYYMERHGYGANMRIVTNMHITDPQLSVDKQAFQHSEEIEYGGIVDATASAEYQFTLTNTGNTKLYNLSWSDATLGLTLNPTTGLTIGKNTDGRELNGVYVMDANGGPLEAKDLSAVVKGEDAQGNYLEITINFQEKDGDKGQTALKNFLHVLQAEGLQSGQDDAEVTKAGSGLWVDASVTIRGIYYMLTPEQINAGVVNNTVYLSVTTKTSPDKVGNKTLYSDASHRMYISGFPIHYQWAGHNIFMNLNKFLVEAKKEAQVKGSQLSLYDVFFESVNSMGEVYTHLCDKYGRVGGEYPYQKAFTDSQGNPGYLINYDEPGIYTFYLLMYKKSGYAASGVNASQIAEGDYAIVRSQVYVADVQDSVYVLDYGLSTESLDLGGELFENDYLFGSYGTVKAKLMGVSASQPSYLDPALVTGNTDYSRIVFDSLVLEDSNIIKTNDGIYKINLSIPGDGKNIAYDSATGEYTLTGVGTVTVNAEVPTDGQWNAPHLYYWYDDGTSGPAWPGTLMTPSNGAGKYQLDIPADVTHVIINNGSGALQTADLTITPGLESTIKVTVDGENKVSATVTNVVGTSLLHAKAPAEWTDIYLHYWRDDGTGTAWPGEKLETVDEAGYYTFELPSDASYVIINNGDGNGCQTNDLDIYSGKEVWIDVRADHSSTNEDMHIEYHDALVKYTNETYTVRASVPSAWGDTVYLYYWHSGAKPDMDWPGVKMTKGDFGWYTLEGIPADVTNMIVTDGVNQTLDLTVTPGLETWLMVNNATEIVEDKACYTATVAYGSESGSTGLTFTPNKFMDSDSNNLWLALTVHSTSANPSPLQSETGVENAINIHNEVQMYKKVTVVPATVVYYEDDFVGIEYSDHDVTSGNVFTHHGEGSGRLFQSVDQELPYGQDPVYQDSSNDRYSGNHMTEAQITDNSKVATFTFTGTGFELVSRTNAVDSASTVAWVYDAAAYANYVASDAYKAYLAACDAYEQYLKELSRYHNGEIETAPAEVEKPTEPVSAKPSALKVLPMITQFDQNNDGGEEGIDQVPTIRITDLNYGSYTVELSGIPTYIFNPDYSVAGTKDTYLYIDGIRIYQPLGSSHDAYSDAENGAVITELRELIVTGQVAVATLDEGSLKLSSGTTTWTENLLGSSGISDFGSYEGSKVDSTDDYLISGPNNEVYMEGTVSTTAVVFYVSETGGGTHELQISVRALDYAKFYGTGSSALNAQIQYGVKLADGTYAWKNLTRVVSGTEQYYSIPYAECPVDDQGRYQIVLRAVNGEEEIPALLSYTNVKLNGLQIETVEGVGEATVLYYLNGFLVEPSYYLCGTINGKEYGTGNEPGELLKFENGRLTLHLEQDSYIAIRRDMAGATLLYQTKGDLGAVTSASLYSENGDSMLFVPAGDVTFTLVQTKNDTLALSYCAHNWDEGEITTAATCTATGERTHSCDCGMKKVVVIPMADHSYTDGSCSCGTTAEEQSKYYLRGSMNDWTANDANRMTLNADGSSSITMELVGNTTYEFKAGSADWSEAYPGDNASLTLAADATVTFTLANGELTWCVHQWDEGKVTAQATCAAEGIKTYTCTACSHTKTVSVATLDHAYEEGICTVCEKIQPCAEHQWKIKTHVGCVDAGATTYTCTVCGETKSQVLSSTGGHICQVKVVSVGTCSTDGKQILACDLCGYSRADILTAAGHNFVDGVCTVCGEPVPCEHEWDDGSITLAPTCTVEGVRTYTCGKCGDTKEESLATIDHTYVDGACGCGARLNRVYFQNSANWSEVNVYAWTPSDEGNTEQAGTWPGSAMTLLDEDAGLYYYDLSAETTMLIFNNGSGAQTENQGIPTDGMNLYIWSIRNWTTYGTDLEFYLRGSMNSWGTDDKMAQNEDGSYTITKTMEAGSYEFKASTADWRIAFPGSNMELTLDADAAVTFTLAVNGYGDMELTYIVETAAVDTASYALNLYSISLQLASNTIVGNMNQVEPDESDPGFDTDPEETPDNAPTVSLKFPSLELSEEVYYNVVFDVSNPEGVEIVEKGLITWTSEIDGTVENAEYVIPGAIAYGDYQMARSQSISAKNLGEELYFKVYLKLADGSYVYSPLVNYSAKTYATRKLADATASAELKSLCVALMNYGAAAQNYFGYKTDDLMNADLTAEQQKLAKAYSADMIADVRQADFAKTGTLIYNGGYSKRYPAIEFGGAFSIAYNFLPTNPVDGEMKLYIWDAETYDALDELTLDNAAEVKTMTATAGGMYVASVTDIAAKELDSTYYVCGVYQSGGVSYCTGVLAYSVGAYCESKAAGTSGVQPLAAATAVYGYYTKLYME